MDNYKKLKGVYFLMVLVVVWAFFVARHQDKIKKEKTTEEVKESTVREPSSKKEEGVKAPDQDASELEKLKAKLQKTKQCYTSGDCAYSQETPKSYDIAVGDDLKKQIDEFYAKFKDDPNAAESLQQVAREYFTVQNGFVQESALQIFKDFPVSEENLQALMEGLKDIDNARIVEMVLPELQRYLGTPYEGSVHQTMGDLMRGVGFVSRAASENVLGFINDQSYHTYLQKLAGMNPKSQSYRNLKSALDEYHRRQMGG